MSHGGIHDSHVLWMPRGYPLVLTTLRQPDTFLDDEECHTCVSALENTPSVIQLCQR
jgi:hypothetical protein